MNKYIIYDINTSQNKDVMERMDEFFKYRPTIRKDKDGSIIYRNFYVYYNGKFQTVLLLPDSKQENPQVLNLRMLDKSLNVPVKCEYKYELGFDELHLSDV